MAEARYSICGRPILRSQSPLIHNHWFHQCNIKAHYFRLIADEIQKALITYRKMGVAGFNVTAPFKQKVIPELSGLTPEARAAGAVNLVLSRGDQWFGYNTDVQGVLETLRTNSFQSDTRTIVIGAGGAARAAVTALKQLTRDIVITNRTDGKAQQLAQEFACDWVPYFQRAAAVRAAQWIIATVTQTEAILQPEWLQPQQVIFDANYINSSLASIAASVGCSYISGHYWLENQAREVFRLFTGQSAPAGLPALPQPELAHKRSNLALIGFMGSGKTSLAKILAAKLRWQLVDLDTLIENEYGETILQIFQHYGEAEFRRREARMLSRVVERRHQVIACGGGVTTIQENCERLQNAATVIMLYARPRAIDQRLERSTRPLLQVEDYRAQAERLFNARLENYLTTADAVIDTELYNLEQTQDLIYAEIEPLLHY